ncbi:MAG: AMP-dependent synthetase, partial [Muribaculaceae bacterium]|nr:AMP-dependent synthetase [Muribaculaceae bacterium]
MTIEEFHRDWCNSDSYVVCRTSGSTGLPKEIHLSKEDMKRSASATNDFFMLRTDARYVCPVSLDYIGGKMMAVRAFINQGELEILPPSNTFAFDGVADLLAVVPSQVPNIIRNYGPEKIRHLIIGGAPLS